MKSWQIHYMSQAYGDWSSSYRHLVCSCNGNLGHVLFTPCSLGSCQIAQKACLSQISQYNDVVGSLDARSGRAYFGSFLMCLLPACRCQNRLMVSPSPPQTCPRMWPPCPPPGLSRSWLTQSTSSQASSEAHYHQHQVSLAPVDLSGM